jgi:hypothetical protein
MRALPLILLVSLPLAGGFRAAQDGQEDKPRTPKNGDTIVAKGCLRGSMLESSEIGFADRDDRTFAAHTFQLKGKKDLLKQLREAHDGYVVEVSGVLKSNLLDTSSRGTQVGNTRIVVGAESTMRNSGATPGSTQALPVLEAKSFEGSSTSCRR